MQFHFGRDNKFRDRDFLVKVWAIMFYYDPNIFWSMQIE